MSVAFGEERPGDLVRAAIAVETEKVGSKAESDEHRHEAAGSRAFTSSSRVGKDQDVLRRRGLELEAKAVSNVADENARQQWLVDSLVECGDIGLHLDVLGRRRRRDSSSSSFL